MHPIDQIQIHFNPDQLFLLNICLGFLMFSVAIDIKIEDFQNVFKYPKKVLVGLISQLLLLPILTVILANFWPMPPSLALGVMLVAVCPGGNISNFATYLADGNTALSVTMTSIVTILAVVFTPLAFTFWSGFIAGTEALQASISVDFWKMMKTIITIIAIPLAIGMALNHYKNELVEKIKQPAKILSMLVFLAFVIVAFYQNYQIFLDYVSIVFFLVLVHNALAIATGYFFSKINGLPEYDRRAISIETGIQNSGLALILIFNFFDGLGGLALVAAWWGIWHMVSGFGMAMLWGRIPLSKK